MGLWDEMFTVVSVCRGPTCQSGRVALGTAGPDSEPKRALELHPETPRAASLPEGKEWRETSGQKGPAVSPAGPEGLPPGGSCQDEVGERVPRHPLAHQTPQTQRRAHPLRALWMRSLPPPGLPAPRVSSLEELSPPPPSPPLSSTAMRPALAVLPLDLSVVSSH